MIMKFIDWSHEQQQPFGALAFVFVGTFFCCTGLMFLVLIHDILMDKP